MTLLAFEGAGGGLEQVKVEFPEVGALALARCEYFDEISVCHANLLQRNTS
jgi:hypothetical protein